MNINREEIALRVLEELQAIAFGEDVKTNHRLTAIRLLIKFLSLNEPEQSDEKAASVVITDEFFGHNPSGHGTSGHSQNKYEQSEYGSNRAGERQYENRRQRRERERLQRKGGGPQQKTASG